MELVILGPGTYQPEVDRHASGYLLKTGGQNIVFDFGRGALDNLMKSGVNYYDIDTIFITHIHADHCEELAPLLHVSLAEPIKGQLRKGDLTIYGPKGIKKTIEHLLFAFNLADKKPRYKILVKELGDGEVVKGGSWSVRGYAVKHDTTINCLAYRLEAERRVFAYSGDNTDCKGLRAACDHADIAVIEASWPKEIVQNTHMTGEDAGKVANESRVRKLVLTHIAPYYLENFDVIGDALKFYGGPVLIAKDLMSVKV